MQNDTIENDIQMTLTLYDNSLSIDSNSLL